MSFVLFIKVSFHFVVEVKKLILPKSEIVFCKMIKFSINNFIIPDLPGQDSHPMGDAGGAVVAGSVVGTGFLWLSARNMVKFERKYQ